MTTVKITNVLGNEPEKEYSKLFSNEHRKKYAQFFTPLPVAEFMADWILGNNKLETVLDPAFGLGIFARVIRQSSSDCQIKGFEIDKNIWNIALNIFSGELNTNILLKDYMFNDWENKYDGIICNPPYFKFHDYENISILKEIEMRLKLKLSGFSNLYTLFLLKSAYQLNTGGRAAYIIPSEFLNSDYGKLVKSYLIKNRLLRYVIIFDFVENIFDDALTTASILLFANDEEKCEVEFINIKNLGELRSLQAKNSLYPNLESSNAISFAELDPSIKWRAYYQEQNALRFKHLVPFSNFGKVVRGIATGSNEFFVFSQAKAKQYQINDKFLLPCVSKSVDIEEPFFTTDDFEKLNKQNKFIYLLNAVDPNELSLKKYLEIGEAEGINKKFLTASRNPWYSLEKRPPAPIWVTVFNRNGLRFIRNEANIRNLTTFHCIYLNLFSQPKIDLLFAYLITSISKDIFNDNRREYGNGLQKFEPNDINKSQMLDINYINQQDEQVILNLFYSYRESVLKKTPNTSLVDEIDKHFIRIFS